MELLLIGLDLFPSKSNWLNNSMEETHRPDFWMVSFDNITKYWDTRVNQLKIYISWPGWQVCCTGFKFVKSGRTRTSGRIGSCKPSKSVLTSPKPTEEEQYPFRTRKLKKSSKNLCSGLLPRPKPKLCDCF